MTVEIALHLLHLLRHGSLGIFLHTGVNSGVNLQAAGIQVIAIVLQELLYILVLGDCLAEILGLAS